MLVVLYASTCITDDYVFKICVSKLLLRDPHVLTNFLLALTNPTFYHRIRCVSTMVYHYFSTVIRVKIVIRENSVLIEANNMFHKRLRPATGH